jgi:hypothetical protein
MSDCNYYVKSRDFKKLLKQNAAKMEQTPNKAQLCDMRA